MILIFCLLFNPCRIQVQSYSSTHHSDQLSVFGLLLRWWDPLGHLLLFTQRLRGLKKSFKSAIYFSVLQFCTWLKLGMMSAAAVVGARKTALDPKRPAATDLRPSCGARGDSAVDDTGSNGRGARRTDTGGGGGGGGRLVRGGEDDAGDLDEDGDGAGGPVEAEVAEGGHDWAAGSGGGDRNSFRRMSTISRFLMFFRMSVSCFMRVEFIQDFSWMRCRSSIRSSSLCSLVKSLASSPWYLAEGDRVRLPRLRAHRRLLSCTPGGTLPHLAIPPCCCRLEAASEGLP